MARRGKSKEELAKIQVRISDKTAKEYQRRSVEAHYKKKALKEQLLDDIGADEISIAVKRGIQKGDARLIELFCKLTGQMPKEQVDLTIKEPRRFVFEVCKKQK